MEDKKQLVPVCQVCLLNVGFLLEKVLESVLKPEKSKHEKISQAAWLRDFSWYAIGGSNPGHPD